jgi:cytochrome c oxidase subunit 3
VSETVLDHGYLPEEHAPDPVIGHGDPTPPGKVAIWLFLASEVMFFIAILGSYIILRSGSAELFAKFAAVLSKPLAGLNTLVLIFSSLTMALSVDAAQKHNRSRLIVCLLLTFLCASGFMIIKSIEYHDKWKHHTIVYRESTSADPKLAKLWVIDGHVSYRDDKELKIHGARMPMPTHGTFDIHLIGEADIKAGGVAEIEGGPPAAHAAGQETEHQEKHEPEYTIPLSAISQDINYLPWKNVFFASYFTLTGVHGIHVLAGMVPIFLLLAQAVRGKIYAPATEYVGLYWHFVDLVWIFLFPLLYLI